MICTVGIDVGSTYTKALVLNDRKEIVTRAMTSTGFRLAETSQQLYEQVLKQAGLQQSDIGYVIATGFGRHMVTIGNACVTDLTASARGAAFLFPGTKTILDVGGQTMKASRLDDKAKVKSFRLNDKCAAGTGAFLEKTARYMGYTTEEIGPLVATSKEAVPISGVCAVFAESEVINQLSLGSAPADIMHGAMTLDQLWSARPVLGHGAYRGPLKGLYMCGAGAHPGGGVTGAPGHNAAREILADRSFFRRLFSAA